MEYKQLYSYRTAPVPSSNAWCCVPNFFSWLS